jgi:hypothetical protein
MLLLFTISTLGRDHGEQRMIATGMVLPAIRPEEVESAARSDPDNPPLTDADLSRMKRVPRVKTMRRALRCAAGLRRTGDNHGPVGLSLRGAVDYDGYDRREILHCCPDVARRDPLDHLIQEGA